MAHECGCGCGIECEFDCREICTYKCCADPRCNHYFVEHELGGKSKILYSKNPAEIGCYVEIETGCQNAGCQCKEFRLQSEQNSQQDSAAERKDGER